MAMLKLQLKVQGCTMNCIICSNIFLISFQVLSNKKSVIVLQSHFYWCITLSLSHFSFLSTKNFTEKKISLTDEILYIKLIPCIVSVVSSHIAQSQVEAENTLAHSVYSSFHHSIILCSYKIFFFNRCRCYQHFTHSIPQGVWFKRKNFFQLLLISDDLYFQQRGF